MAYSLYRTRLNSKETDYVVTIENERETWEETVENNAYVICKTHIAKQITKRTLVVCDEIKINSHYFDAPINQMKNKKNSL